MEHYVTDDEQVEAIKKWWKANGGAIIAGILIGLAVIFGWQYWSSYRTGRVEQASRHYDQLVQLLQKDNKEDARQQGNLLIEDFSNSLYAVLAALKLAKLAIDEGDNGTAAKQLQWVMENADQDEVKDIARLRLAQVLLAEGKLDEAELRLEQVSNDSFTAEREELKGDLYLARHQTDQARTAYQAALATGNGSALLQMKLDNLSVLAHQEES
jgi:predicted negative regulator of RcsB-dependent stress response